MLVQHIAFENRFAGAFEAVHEYCAIKVVDCLEHVLNDITGESFGHVDDIIGIGDPDRPAYDAQREAIVAGWRGYLARSRAMPRAPCKSLPSS